MANIPGENWNWKNTNLNVSLSLDNDARFDRNPGILSKVFQNLFEKNSN